LTGFPNYPGGKIYAGYRQRPFQFEDIEGISVVRVPLIPDHSSSAFLRILCYLSLTLTMCVPGLFLVQKPDVVHVYQGSATLALPAMLMRFFRRVPYVLDVQDLWPESVTSSGMLKHVWFESFLNFWCKMTYKYAQKIVVLSPGYRDVLIERGVRAEKIEVVYNWCDENQATDTILTGPVSDIFKAACFTVVYAGNLGVVQRLDAVLGAAEILKVQCPEVRFAFIGDGVDSERLKSVAVEKKLDNVVFVPRQPSSNIGAILARADALLIHLRDDPLCRVGIPQKTQAYMAAGRPVIVGVKGNAADIVLAAEAGLFCEPENPSSIAETILQLQKLPPEELEKMAQNGRSYYQKKLSFAVGSKQMESVFEGCFK
ncbi:MAG: glycosyltransferase family 4 protein, partial [Desulfuromusa sp.]|nr:glycosyltransferase family 4 protein [Desulfuromusa sp.]